VNWRAVIIWTALSLVTWFFLVAIIGFLAGMVIQQAYELEDVPLGQAGVLVPIVISVGLLPRLAVGFLLATTIWALLVKRLPRLEDAKKSYVGFLAVYSVAVGALAWLAFPLNQPFVTYGALLFVACFVLPRFLTSRLSPGVFAA
jgi:hypothetical protein